MLCSLVRCSFIPAHFSVNRFFQIHNRSHNISADNWHCAWAIPGNSFHVAGRNSKLVFQPILRSIQSCWRYSWSLVRSTALSRQANIMHDHLLSNSTNLRILPFGRTYLGFPSLHVVSSSRVPHPHIAITVRRIKKLQIWQQGETIVRILHNFFDLIYGQPDCRHSSL